MGEEFAVALACICAIFVFYVLGWTIWNAADLIRVVF